MMESEQNTVQAEQTPTDPPIEAPAMEAGTTAPEAGSPEAHAATGADLAGASPRGIEASPIPQAAEASEASASPEASATPTASDASADIDEEVARQMGGQSMEELIAGQVAAEAANAGARADRGAADVSSGERESDGSTDGVEGGHPLVNTLQRGRIAAARGSDVFVDLTGEVGKLQAMVPAEQFDRPPRVGSIMDFVVTRVDEGQGLIHLSREGAVQRSTWDQLTRGSRVEARVTGTNKGGLECELAGGIKAFMPASQASLGHVDDLSTLVGEKLRCIVGEVDRKHKRIIISHRQYLQAEREQQAKKALAELEPGAIVEGTVSNLVEFGAFVDLGGVDGLVHISDLSHQRVHKPSDVVQQGQSVRVKVLEIDEGKGRIKLGLKQVEPDPWEGIGNTLAEDETVTGRITRTAPFGAFVEIQKGVEALLPISELSWSHVHRTEDVVRVDQVVQAKVIKFEPDRKRATLSLKQAAGDPWADAEARFPRHAMVKGKVTGVKDFGAFVEIEPGVEGMVHISELDNKHVKQVTDVVKVGDERDFRVLELDVKQRRLKLSLKAAGDKGMEELEAQIRRDEKDSKRRKAARVDKSKLSGGMGQNGALGMGLGDLKL